MTLENFFTCTPTHVFPWLSQCHWPWALPTHPFIYPTLVAFTGAMKTAKLSSTPGPLTSLRGNPNFSPGNQTHSYDKNDHMRKCSHTSSSQMDVHTCMNIWCLRRVLIHLCSRHRQLRHFFSTHDPTMTWNRQHHSNPFAHANHHKDT